MKLTGPMLVVSDLARSRAFYQTVLQQRVIMDFGANITFSGGFFLQTQESWADFIQCQPEEIQFGGKDAELYFEEEDFDGFYQRLQSQHPLGFVRRCQRAREKQQQTKA